MRIQKIFYIILAFFLIGELTFATEKQLPKLRLPPEQIFTFIYKNLEFILPICLTESECTLSTDETELVKKIVANLSSEVDKLSFDSGKKNPSLFLKDGNVRIAVTGDNVGSPIFINLDLAFSRGKFGNTHSLGLERIVAILVHELGHHHGWMNHSLLDQLGLKIGMYFLTRFEMTEIAGESNQDPDLRPLELYLGVLQLPFESKSSDELKNPSKSLLWIFDETQALDITNQIVDQLKCPINSSNKAPKMMRSFNWEAIAWRYGGERDFRSCPSSHPQNQESYRIDFFTMQSDLQIDCQQLLPNAKISIDFGFHRQCNSKSALGVHQTPYIFDSFRNVRIF